MLTKGCGKRNADELLVDDAAESWSHRGYFYMEALSKRGWNNTASSQRLIHL